MVRELGSSVQCLPESKFWGETFWEVSSELWLAMFRKGSGLQTAQYRLASNQSIGLRRH
jgi:hypothetical protein